MKVLIGAPIHISKDYSFIRWIENVTKLQKVHDADLLLADNSPHLDYMEKLNKYIKKHALKNCKVIHLEVKQHKDTDKNRDENIHERIIRSEEIIRKEFLRGGYDIFFFWESDILIPTNALGKLMNLMNSGNFNVVIHNSWVNNVPNKISFDFGITLFRREVLEKYSFIPSFRGPDPAPSWYYAENWYIARLKKDGCNLVEVAGLIEPIYHLAK